MEQFGESSNLIGPSEGVTSDAKMSLCFVLTHTLILQLLTDKHLALRLGKEIEVWLHKPEFYFL